MRRAIAGLACAVLVLACALVLGTLLPRPFFAPTGGIAGNDGSRILVLSNAIHTDIAIPIDDRMRASFAFLADEGFPLSDPNAHWLVFGWGGRTFYLETPTWAELRPMPVLRSFTVDRSVMHVEIAGTISDRMPGVTPLRLSDSGYQRLVDFVSGSFLRQSGAVMPIPGAAYGQYDRFFEAQGSFNAFFGCNTWTARALRSAGLRTGIWNPLPQTLAFSLSLYN